MRLSITQEDLMMVFMTDHEGAYEVEDFVDDQFIAKVQGPEPH